VVRDAPFRVKNSGAVEFRFGVPQIFGHFRTRRVRLSAKFPRKLKSSGMPLICLLHSFYIHFSAITNSLYIGFESRENFSSTTRAIAQSLSRRPSSWSPASAAASILYPEKMDSLDSSAPLFCVTKLPNVGSIVLGRSCSISENKLEEACRGEATMRMVVRVFLFLDLALGGLSGRKALHRYLVRRRMRERSQALRKEERPRLGARLRWRYYPTRSA
jgi:hypothetical protein